MAIPSKDELHAHYYRDGLSLRAIGRIYGVSGRLVSMWMEVHGIPRRTLSEATSLAQKGKPLTEAQYAALVKNAANARKHITAESHRKQSESMKGKPAWNKGKTTPPEVRAKIKESWKRDPEATARRIEKMRGENSPHWKGGVKPELARRLDRMEWRKLRIEIYARDNWTCQECGCKCKNTRDSKNDGGAKIQCHHIVSRRDGGTDEPANLVTLCMSCHHKRERAKRLAAAT